MSQFADDSAAWTDDRPEATGGVPGPRGTLPTGHPDVDATVASLADLAAVPPTEQVERYAEVHRSLQQILRTIDAA